MLAAEIVRLALAEPYRGLLYEGQPPFLHLQSEYLPRTQSGLMLFFFQLASESADGEPVRQRWHTALRQIMEGRARPQLEQARQWLITRHQQAMRNPVERARLYGLYATLGMPTLPDEYLQRVQALNLEYIEQIVQHLLSASQSFPSTRREYPLQQAHPASERNQTAQPSLFHQILPNRMRVIALRQPGAKQVVMQLLIATGPDAERDFPTGTSELTARMLFTTTQNETQATLASRIAGSGGALQLHAEPIGVRITAVAEPASMENVLALLREGLTRAEFEADALQRALQAAQAERQRMDGTHELPLYDALLRQLIEGGTLYARTAELQQVRLEHIRAFYSCYYRPERFVLVIAGDMPAEQLIELVQRHWSSVSPLTSSVPPAGWGNLKEGVITCAIAQPEDAPTLYLGFGLCTEVRSPEEYAALLTLHALLCEGKQSLLFQRFRSAQGVGYAFGGLPIVWQGKGFLLGFLQVGHTRLAQRDTLLQQMETIVRTAALKPEALQRAVALVEGRWRRDALDLFERTRRLALAEASGIGYLAEQNLPKWLQQVNETALLQLLEKCSSSAPLGVK
jgi:predicted Zn-dependent peptidase